MKITFHSLVLLSILFVGSGNSKKNWIEQSPAHLRYNLVGYSSDDTKEAIVFSQTKQKGNFELVQADNGKVVFSGKLVKSDRKGWGRFPYYHLLDFTEFHQKGEYFIRLSFNDQVSSNFIIGENPFGNYHEDLLFFMRQQRCGYNPFLDIVCHQRDGRTFYGPMADSTFIDVSGGWHDAGDQLKYLITSSNATARMILAYELEPNKFDDRFDKLGHRSPDGIPDILDEVRWGLEWIHKMHPRADQLFHQVADDRDHLGWKWPDKDNSDYGWGPNSYRPVYFADGKPQGLRQYKSLSTGVANIAGRSAAAMASAYRVWKNDLKDSAFADYCLKAAIELYTMGKRNEGYQQGNSYGAPYRYNEDTWTDDMEWAAAELFKGTGKQRYLEEAKAYALLSGSGSWMEHDSVAHYQYYPFLNIAHFVLYPLVDEAFKAKLGGFYLSGIEKIKKRADMNPFDVGVPFIWCSNNLVTALITQILLYEKMTGDMQYHELMISHRDWLLGRNPWGTSMFTGIPEGGEYPEDVHTSIWYLTKQEVPGGLVDGPVYTSIYNNLRGLILTRADEFKELQNDFVVYHDDIGDYSTNEPTMDGTAGAIYFMAHFGKNLR